MKRYLPPGVVVLLAAYFSVTAFQCGSAEMTTAKLAIQNKQYDKAEASLQKAVAKNPQDEEAWYMLGQVRLEQKNYAGMNEAYAKALSISDEHKSDINTNRLAIWNRLYNAAIDDFDKAQDQPEFYDAAIEKLSTAVIVNPDSVQTYYALGLVHAQKNEGDKASSYLTTSLEKDPKYTESMYLLSDIHLRKAADLENAGNAGGAADEYGAAADILERAFRIEPERSETINNLILSLDRSGQEERALNLTTEAVEKNPENPSFRYAYGVYLLKKSDYAASVEQFRKAVDLDPTNANFAYNCGVAYLNWGVAMKQEADKHLEANKGKNVKPDLSYREKFQDALPYLKKSTELSPDDAEFWQSLAKAYTYLGMIEESKAAFAEFDRLTGDQ